MVMTEQLELDLTLGTCATCQAMYAGIGGAAPCDACGGPVVYDEPGSLPPAPVPALEAA